MKALKWPINSEQHAYMKTRQDQNLARDTKAEIWMEQKLRTTGYKWRAQAQWGYRLFDFWCHELGVAIEVDGASHIKSVDEYRDAYNFYRSGIKVIRVRNFNEQDARDALGLIANINTWAERRKNLGLDTPEGIKAARKKWKKARSLGEAEDVR